MNKYHISFLSYLFLCQHFIRFVLLRSAAILNADRVYLLMYSHTQTLLPSFSLLPFPYFPLYFPSFFSLVIRSPPSFHTYRISFYSSNFLSHIPFCLPIHISPLRVFLFYSTISPTVPTTFLLCLPLIL